MTTTTLNNNNNNNSNDYHSKNQKNYQNYQNHNSSSTPPQQLQPQTNYQKIKHIDQKTINQLDQFELQRQWGPHLAPLQYIIQRTIAQVFHSLQLAAQISPTLEEHDRKKRVVDFIIHSRRQLIKLLVLIKWSSNSSSVHKIMSIVAFLQRQNNQFERTVNILRASKENFHSARMRNYDIPTALQVLTNRYPTLPGQLIEQFDSKPKLSDTEVIEIMHELNQLIRYRLASHEVIPKDFRSYRIYDGRVFFKIDKMFECSLTVGGGQLDARWFLLNVEFLFKVTGPRGKDFLPIPQGPTKTQIIECGNTIMGPSALPTETAPDPKPPERPIMKVFAYLRDLCLNYQLEALHYQASQLGRSAWAKHTRLSIPPDRSTLTILYWTHARPVNPPLARPGQTAKNPPTPTPLGSLTIRRHVERHNQSRTRVLNFLNSYPSLSPSIATSSQDGQDDGDFGATFTERLQTIWRPIEITSNLPAEGKSTPEELEKLLIREGKEVVFFNKQVEKGSVELELAMNELSLEDVLQRVVRIHTDCILRRVFADLTRSEQSSAKSTRSIPHFRSIRLIPWENNATAATRYAKSIEIVLHARHAVELSIDEFSGRFRLQSVIVPSLDHARSNESDQCESIDHKLRTCCLGGFNSVNVLSSSANSINYNPSGLRDVLARLKSDILLDQIELKARLLGIRTSRSLPIQIQQVFKLAPRPSYSPSQSVSSSIMYCKLSNFTYHYLLIQVTEIGIRCALIWVDDRNAYTRHSGQSFWNVRQVLDLHVPSFVGDSDDDGEVLDQFTLSRAQLQHLYNHCLVQVTLSRIMEGLKKDGISHEQFLPLAPQMIEKQALFKLDHQTCSEKFKKCFPTLHPSFEVVGLLSIPLLGFLNPTLVTQKQFFTGNHLAVKVFIRPNSYFGVGVELRFKFNHEKIKSAELERVISSKQSNLNSRIIATYLSNRPKAIPTPPPKAAEPPRAPAVIEEEEEDDEDDEEPLSKRIQNVKFIPTSQLGIFTQRPQPVEREEEEEEITSWKDEQVQVLSSQEIVVDSDWKIDSNLHQFIFTSNFSHIPLLLSSRRKPHNDPSLDIYPSSIRKFFNLIHTSSDLLNLNSDPPPP